jgi:hypothetical protein
VATLTEAFERFDAVPTNIRYSWSAFSRDGSKLVCTLWQHEFDAKKYTLWSSGWKGGSVGWNEQRRNLDKAIAGGIPITGFVVIAKDPKAGQLSVEAAKTDRLFYLNIIEHNAEWIVGQIAKTEVM